MTAKSSVENTDKPTDRQTDKCKNCGHKEANHLLSKGIRKECYWDGTNNCECKKFIAEDESVDDIDTYIDNDMKEKKDLKNVGGLR